MVLPVRHREERAEPTRWRRLWARQVGGCCE
ncbi:uncharacterized protein M6B38_387470 [Iris pallida]|uniref:Uncharacterized protein n=1 Tax=Iris pallida TaxID=29817 RepID=A0AAX6G266_IRIPA|nr:uncharacterized protein M6B38_387470 [Iris pallida]